MTHLRHLSPDPCPHGQNPAQRLPQNWLSGVAPMPWTRRVEACL